MAAEIKVALAQISPIWLNKTETLKKIDAYIRRAANEGAAVIAFGEALCPGYPFWLSFSGGAAFDNHMQKEIHAKYLDQGVCIEKGDLDALCKLCAQLQIATYLGIMERSTQRGGHSLYCSLVYINEAGTIQSVHRKLQPTYEERLAWAAGDGHGLRVHDLRGFRIGGLNCWENWMPLSRAALYAQGMNIHVAVWPGAVRNTIDLTSFIAKESRSYVLSVSGVFSKEMIPKDFPFYDQIYQMAPEKMADGGSCVCAPDGTFLLEPQADTEGLFYAHLDLNAVYKQRQNFDPAGHYSRPDVTKLYVNRRRQSLVEFDSVGDI